MTQASGARRLLTRFCYRLGGAGLLVAMATDAASVTGRHAGFSLLGSIEIVQAAMVLGAGTAMIVATLADRHASVHILTDRLPPAGRARLFRVTHLLSALTLASLAAGSLWVMSDLWNAQEITELLQLPLRWLRLAWVVCAVAIALLFLVRALRRGEPGHGA